MDLRYLLVPVAFFIVFVIGAALLNLAIYHPWLALAIFLTFEIYMFTHWSDEESDLF